MSITSLPQRTREAEQHGQSHTKRAMCLASNAPHAACQHRPLIMPLCQFLRSKGAMHCRLGMAVSHLWSLKARSRTCTMLSMGRLKCFAMQFATSITVRSFCVPML